MMMDHEKFGIPSDDWEGRAEYAEARVKELEGREMRLDRMDYATDQHAKILVVNADLVAERDRLVADCAVKEAALEDLRDIYEDCANAAACDVGRNNREHAREVMKVIKPALSDNPSAALLAERNRTYPEIMTPELEHVLGLMNFRTGPIAHVLQAAGRDIPKKAEAEQAHVLHWLIKLALDHPEDWSDRANTEIKALDGQKEADDG